MNQPEYARLIYAKILAIARETESSEAEKIETLYRLLNAVFIESVKDEGFYFSSMSARIIHAGHRFGVPGQILRYIHVFRIEVGNMRVGKPLKNDVGALYRLGLKVVTETVNQLLKSPPEEPLKGIVRGEFDYKTSEFVAKARKDVANVAIVGEHEEEPDCFLGYDMDEPSRKIRISYKSDERTYDFDKTVWVIRRSFQYPICVNLLDVSIDDAGTYHPKGFVVEPDYLMDVTAIAECHRAEGIEPYSYLLKKFLPYETTTSIMVGNIANFFLDELIARPEETFQEMFQKVFKKLNPLAFCIYENSETRKIMDESQKHYVSLKRMVGGEFQSRGIDPKDCFLEPSFYSQKYGLQGRLDVFYQNSRTKHSAIVELKSGKLFKPNIHQINPNHFTQTLLYGLLIDSTFPGKSKAEAYILYSVLERDNLKPVPYTKTLQYQAIDVRNQLLAIEYSVAKLMQKPFSEDNIFSRMIAKLSRAVTGFEKTNLNLFQTVYEGMDLTERKYFCAFASFIAKEHRLAKTGVQGMENLNGVATLWLNDLSEKMENFGILGFLKLSENQSDRQDPFLIFQRTERTNELANFRVGDIVVLYPAHNAKGEDSRVLDNQIFKCTITALDKESVSLRLRSRQLNQSLFNEVSSWHVEPDMLDSSFVGMNKGLFEFARSPKRKRDLILTREAPSGAPEDVAPDLRNYLSVFNLPDELTEEQARILAKIIRSRDYFLLWGPPGTGKTSIMIKHLVAYLLAETDENILLLAYTNRAVDEICEAIENIGTADKSTGTRSIKEQYLRIGSRFSTSLAYHDQLLDKKIESIKSRAELKGVIGAHRIFVATVSAMSGKSELLELKQFSRVIIDEASRTLEPMLAGLLPRFNHFLLIGDHKQLPAVVSQSEGDSATLEPELEAIGLSNLRNSLFERLYRNAIGQSWHHAYDRLSHQGRMHSDIMHFPNIHFYEDKLRILPEGLNLAQKVPAHYKLPDHPNAYDRLIGSGKRTLFIHTNAERGGNSQKTNTHEAEVITEIVASFYRIFKANDKEVSLRTIGVITPYRAQIARIRKSLQDKGMDPDALTIDTVERYQGGARDVIIISLCVNDAGQLNSLVSLSEEGVDRKLNVALTRAREHLIVVGNRQVLENNVVYSDLIRMTNDE